MELAVSAASWAVGKALAPVTGGVLEAWAATKELGPNVEALKEELLYAQAMLENTRGREIRSPSLKELLSKLRQLAYDADDVLDELDYFRIQDELDGTYHAADAHAGGCVHGLALNARHTARAVAAKLNLCSGGSDDGILAGDPHQQDNNVKQRCFSSVCSCGGRTASSSPPSPTNQHVGQEAALACGGIRNGCQLFGGVVPSKVQRCFSGARLCGKRETSAPSSQCEKKVGGRCGCLSIVTSTAHSTAQVVGKCFPCCSFSFGMFEKTNMPEDQSRFLCWTSKVQRGKNTALPPELKFNRVDISTKMKDIIEHLKPICAKVSNILNLEFMGTNRFTEKDIAKKRPITTPEITEPQLYGRERQKKIILEIVHGNSSAENDLVVLPIVGPGGIGKTTFTQHVYDELKNNPFEVAIWICVSLNFNAGRLAQEAVEKIPKVDNEKQNSSVEELIEQRLKAKRFLLVLDDMWACHEDEWKKMLAPFQKGGGKGCMVIVTTRMHKVANMVKMVHCPIIQMERLEDEQIMRFFEVCIFGNQNPWEGHTKQLLEVGKEIVRKLKGFPLAAKTVGRLLRDQPTLKHWNRVLHSKEWELQSDENDIMPALKLSYDYLPFHLQQCFYYCALFPEDYEFNSKELVLLWIGLDIVHPCDLNQTIEETGQSYLNGLVDHGFLKKNERKDGCYVVHDLLHNLAVNISSFECLSICSSNIKSIQIRQDVRHLSIIIDNKDVEDVKNFKYYKNDLSSLDRRLNVENLRTLMVFGGRHGNFAKPLCDLFQKARALRVIYLSGASAYAMEDMWHKFPKLLHLRYLNIKWSDVTAFNLSALTRLYHLEVIDLQKSTVCHGFTRHISDLPKLRHFLVPEHNMLQLHSDIVDVGKLKLLQELSSFEVGKKDKGFEISQLGQLSELGGSLAIYSLERLRETEEVHEARLIQMKYLDKLTLQWDANRTERDARNEEDTLENLIPHSNLLHLCIRGHGGTKCPKWLGENLSVKNLRSLQLDGVAWNIFPPIGEFSLVNEPREEISNNNIHHDKFQNLKRLELVMLPRLRNWTVKAPCHLFAQLEVLVIKDCCELTELSFSHYNCCQQHKEANMKWFPELQELKVKDCPKLLSFPPIPWTRAPCSAEIKGIGSGLEKLICKENYKSDYCLEIKMKDALASELWNVLSFDNLAELKELNMDTCPPLRLHHLQMLSSLKTLHLSGGSSVVFQSVEGESHAEYQFPVERITIRGWDACAKELTQLLNYFDNLSKLTVASCEKITGLVVVEKQARETPVPSSDNKVDNNAEIEKHQQQDGRRGEEERAAEGLLLLPSQLQELEIYDCRELSLVSNLIEHSGKAAQTAGAQGLQGLHSLRLLHINQCPRFLSSYSPSSSSSCPPFPTSLERLSLWGAMGTTTPLPLSNLISLTDLTIGWCGEPPISGLRHLLAQGRLTKLDVDGTPNFWAGPEPPLPHEQEFPSSSSKLQELWTDGVAGVLAASICTLLSSSLTELGFNGDKVVERFTKEQEEALLLLTSLEEIRFWLCDKLQCLPAGLHGLPNLKRLSIYNCPAIRSLPKDGLPSSLQKLEIEYCSAIRSLSKDCLPSSLQKLKIWGCPAIRSLPKGNDLPSSLRELDVRYSDSEELRRQCRKLIGIIPVVYA